MTFFRQPPHCVGADLGPVAEVVSDKVWRAMHDASALLQRLGVKHALVGGLAMAAYGCLRATNRVEFIVDDSAWLKTDAGLVVLRVGLPVQAHGVAIDTLSVRDDERHLLGTIETPEVSEGVPVAPIEAVVYMKLASPRSKDRQDVIELVRAGADVGIVRRYLEAHAPHLVAALDAVVKTVEREEGL